MAADRSDSDSDSDSDRPSETSSELKSESEAKPKTESKSESTSEMVPDEELQTGAEPESEIETGTKVELDPGAKAMAKPIENGNDDAKTNPTPSPESSWDSDSTADLNSDPDSEAVVDLSTVVSVAIIGGGRKTLSILSRLPAETAQKTVVIDEKGKCKGGSNHVALNTRARSFFIFFSFFHSREKEENTGNLILDSLSCSPIHSQVIWAFPGLRNTSEWASTFSGLI